MPVPSPPGRLALAGALAAVLALSGCTGPDEQEPHAQATTAGAAGRDRVLQP